MTVILDRIFAEVDFRYISKELFKQPREQCFLIRAPITDLCINKSRLRDAVIHSRIHRGEDTSALPFLTRRRI